MKPRSLTNEGRDRHACGQSSSSPPTGFPPGPNEGIIASISSSSRKWGHTEPPYGLTVDPKSSSFYPTAVCVPLDRPCTSRQPSKDMPSQTITELQPNKDVPGSRVSVQQCVPTLSGPSRVLSMSLLSSVKKTRQPMANPQPRCSLRLAA